MVPEYIIEICVAIDIAIIGIAYPIIIDKISNIGDKYSSQYIPILFNAEFPQRSLSLTIRNNEYRISFFKLILYLTLISLFTLIFQCAPPFGWDNWLINNSAKLLVLLLSSILTVSFFIWLNKLALYNGSSKSLLMHVIEQYDSINDNTQVTEYRLKAINELTFYAIQKQDEHLQETLLEFYYTFFSNIRRQHDKKFALVYPIDIYFLVNKLNSESASIENKKLRSIEYGAVSGAWLLGEDFEDIIISEQTYNWLWSNIYFICDSPRLVKMFWANSSQYYNYRLQTIHEDYNYDLKKIVNQTEINYRKKERERFLEFHYALGGLSLYRKQYELIKYIFEYSQSQPPKYILLPESMTEIFYWFEYFRNPFKNIHSSISLKYSFPDLDNLGNRGQVNYWICSYIALLFLRQYSLQKYLTYQNFTELPNLPDDILELNNWLDSIAFFKKCLSDVLSNKELIKDLKYEDLVELNKEKFSDFIHNLKEAVKRKVAQQKFNADLSQSKITAFYQKSNEIILKAFNEYKSIFINKDDRFSESELKLVISGATTLISKAAFTDNDIPNLNYDTFFANSIVHNNIQRQIPNSFAVSRTKRYLLKKETVLLALSKIVGINTDIVVIGVSISYQIKDILESSIFKSQIQYIRSTEPMFRDVIFILRKGDLPAIEHREMTDDNLVLINTDLKIYASVIDINNEKNQEVEEKWNLGTEPEDNVLKIQLTISFLSIIYWKNAREVIQISIESQYKEQGIVNDLNDIEPLGNSSNNA